MEIAASRAARSKRITPLDRMSGTDIAAYWEARLYVVMRDVDEENAGRARKFKRMSNAVFSRTAGSSCAATSGPVSTARPHALSRLLTSAGHVRNRDQAARF